MQLHEERVVNGILKALHGLGGPDAVLRVLSRDIEIVADPARANSQDLWPAIWALAAVLSRQFYGKVFIRCGLTTPLPAPALLAGCIFGTAPTGQALRIGLGVALDSSDPTTLGWGDARGADVTYQNVLATDGPAHPIGAFALAGYLGFAALAATIGIPPSRDNYITSRLTLPVSPGANLELTEDGLAFIGLGQLGQAYSALLFFLLSPCASPRTVFLDRDIFGLENGATQILLEKECTWLGVDKAKFLGGHFKAQGWKATGEVTELVWGWRRPRHHPRLAMLGLDAFDPRRMAIEAGYDWIVEAGVGTSFLEPLVTWHSLPPDRTLASSIFVTTRTPEPLADTLDSPFLRDLQETPGACGWVTFQNVQATAPSMGLVASAYAWAEMFQVLAGRRAATMGCARLWSPLLPYYRAGIATHPTEAGSAGTMC